MPTIRSALVQWTLVLGYIDPLTGHELHDAFHSTEQNTVAAFEDAVAQAKRRLRRRALISHELGELTIGEALDALALIDRATPWLIERAKA